MSDNYTRPPQLPHPHLPPNSLDTQEIIRRSKRRRLPRTIGTGLVSTLAIVGLGIAGVSGLAAFPFTGASSSDSAVSSEAATDDFTSDSQENADSFIYDAPNYDSSPLTESGESMPPTVPAEKLNLCGAPLAEAAPSATGLQLTVDFPTADAGSASVTGTVTLTNAGTGIITGTTPATPIITLSQNNVVIWHSNGPTIMMITEVNLSPGESLTYPASFTPVVCGPEDDSGESFRNDLPPAPAGSYEVSAAIDLTLTSSPSASELITGPRFPVVLR